MGNFIQAMVIKDYAGCRLNRDRFGNINHMSVGGSDRMVYSSWSLLWALRKYMELDEIRVADIPELIETMTDQYIKDGILLPEARETAITALEGVFYDKKAPDSKNKKKKETEEADEDSEDAEDDGKKKGRTIIFTNVDELHKIFDTVFNSSVNIVDALNKASGETDNKKKKAIIAKTVSEISKEARESLDKIPISVAKAMLGMMATEGAFFTIYSAVQISNSYGLERYEPMTKDWTANPVVRYRKPNTSVRDPFYGGLEIFASEQSRKKGADNIQSHEIASSTMYTYANVEPRLFRDNFRLRAVEAMTDEDVSNAVGKYTAKFVEGLALVEPEGGQSRNASHVAPAIVYIEKIRNGQNRGMDNNKPLEYDYFNKKSICEQGLDRMLRFARDRAFRNGEITAYAWISGEYADDYEEKFREIGVTIIHSIKEMREIVSRDAVDLLN